MISFCRRNVGWASTCNSVGQTAGYFLGNILFLALESADFCNKYLRYEPQDAGVVTLAGKFSSIAYYITYSVYVHISALIWQELAVTVLWQV
jgi:hypothetical protein